MSNTSSHLSEDQIAKCVAGSAVRGELQHAAECAMCGAEVQRLSAALSLFRGAVRDRVEQRVVLRPSGVPPRRGGPVPAGFASWRWTWVAGAVVALVIPFFVAQNRPRPAIPPAAADMNAEAIMERVNLHLSRTVPAPMEPVLSLIPSEDITNVFGGPNE